MACLFSAAVRLLLLGLFISTEPASSVGDFERVSVFSGETATLPCSAPDSINDIRKTTVEWTKPGLNKTLLVCRGGYLVADEQDCSYKSRVELAEPELKNRSLSMILKNVTEKDEGRYECHFITFIEAAPRQKRAAIDTGPIRPVPKIIKTIDLEVKEKPGYDKNVGGSIEGGSIEGGSIEGGSNEGGSNEGGRARIIAGIMCGLVVLVGVGFFVLRKIKKREPSVTNKSNASLLESGSESGSGPESGPG